LRLAEIYEPIHEELSLVENEIRRQAGSIESARSLPDTLVRYIDQVVGHIFSRPGKLLRPALVIFSSRMLGPGASPADADLVSFAAAVEFFHSASLIHDDIIDEEQFRRDQPTLHRMFGNHIAVLVGDILYAKFFSLMTNLRVSTPSCRLEVFSLFCDVTERMCIAEIIEQHLLETAGGAGPEDYLMILQYKTADLMSACCEGSAILCGAGAAEKAALAGFGRSFGMAFQLFDDSRDGDAIVRSVTDIQAKAREYIAQAERHLSALPANDTRRLMEVLCRLMAQEGSLGT
jgi:octaprenyl-diphosphate synthase